MKKLFISFALSLILPISGFAQVEPPTKDDTLPKSRDYERIAELNDERVVFMVDAVNGDVLEGYFVGAGLRNRIPFDEGPVTFNLSALGGIGMSQYQEDAIVEDAENSWAVSGRGMLMFGFGYATRFDAGVYGSFLLRNELEDDQFIVDRNQTEFGIYGQVWLPKNTSVAARTDFSNISVGATIPVSLFGFGKGDDDDDKPGNGNGGY